MMKTTTEWFRIEQGWKQVNCHGCGGHGLVSNYGYGGTDFYGAKECNCCRGNGIIWQTPKGRFVLYPGGPFV